MFNCESENRPGPGQLSTESQMGDRLCYGGVCSRLDLIKEHIEKHRLDITPQEYLTIADLASVFSLSEPVPSDVNFVGYNGKTYRVVLNGEIVLGDRTFRIIRSVVYAGKLKEPPIFPGFYVKVKVKGPEVTKTYDKGNLPLWSLLTVQDAIERFQETGQEKNSYWYKQPVLHLVRVRKNKRDTRNGKRY